MTNETITQGQLVDVTAETMAGAMRRVPANQGDDLARLIAVAALGHLRITQGEEWLLAFMAGVIDRSVPPCLGGRDA